MGKVVVEVVGGVVTQVLTDDPGIQLLVLDRETSGVSPEFILPDVLDGPATVDAMAEGLPECEPEKVERAFREAFECLAAPKVQGHCLETIRGALKELETTMAFLPETPKRIQGIFEDVGFDDVTAVPGPGASPDTCDIYHVLYGKSQRCIAALERKPSGWTAIVYGNEFDGDEAHGHCQQLAIPSGASAFIAAAYVREFFDNHAKGEFELS
ncbi:MAG TPA: hypothetical protein VJP83_16660 [Terriglobales bacterium]|nr:hypothetical protein [Terriglobales bacterium]